MFYKLSFYHLPFVTLNTCVFIFLSLFIFSLVILLLICKIQFAFLNLKMISERSKRRKIISLVFILRRIKKQKK